jgi:hypothetical protein
MRNLISSLSLMVTYQCNVACRHCGPYCGPEEGDWISLEEMKDLVLQANELGASVVVFTGGEPTLLKEKLVEMLQFIKQNTKIKFTRIVTNGKWATTPEIATAKLKEWQDAGLAEINISCGEFHQEWVPMESVINAYRAAVDLNFKTVLLAGEFLNQASSTFPPQLYEKALGGKPFNLSTLSPYSEHSHGMSCGAAMPSGRGKKYITGKDTVMVTEDRITSICNDVNSVITVHPNGNVTACCGVMVREDSLLTIGNWRQGRLRKILEESSEDIILNWIKYLGLKDMKEWLQKKDPTIKFSEKYTSICHLCSDILYNAKNQKLLLEQGHERNDEIIVNKVARESTVNNTQYSYI